MTAVGDFFFGKIGGNPGTAPCLIYKFTKIINNKGLSIC